MTSNDGLPRFGKPPVVETVLGVHFHPLEGFSSAHQGVFWDRYFRSQFPVLEEKAPVEEQQERFGEERILLGGNAVRWQILDRPEAPRLWAASANGEHVIQIQRNALFANWQKTAENAAYRPFHERRSEFASQLGCLEQFIGELNIGTLKPTSWVVTYINHVEYESEQNVGSAVSHALTVWANETSDDWLPGPDKVALQVSFPFPEHIGRLNVSCTPVVRLSDKRDMLRIDLTARGRVKTRDLDAVLQGIDLGHEWVVRGFASLTRPGMHRAWERLP